MFDQLDKNNMTVQSYTTEAEGIELKYLLLETVHSLRDERIYSIKISSNSDNGAEAALAFDVTRNIDRAKELLDILCRNTVTPCSLFEVLEDIL